MNIREIRKLSDEEILNSIEDLKEALFNYRFQEVAGQLEDGNMPRRTQRDIARLKTILRERQLATQVMSKEGR